MSITQCSQGEWTVKGLGAEACFIPSSDGSDYRDDESQPLISDIPFAMRDAKDYHIRTTRKPIYDFIVVAIGKLGSSSRNVSGISIITDAESINRTQRSSGTYQEKLSNLFNTNTPFRHVSAFVIKPAT